MPRVFFPLLVAFILSMVLRPILPKMEKLRLPRTISIFLLFAGLGFFLVYPIVKFAPVIQKESDNFQYYIPKIESQLEKGYDDLRTEVRDRVGVDLPVNIIDQASTYVEKSVRNFLLQVPNVLASVLEWLLLVPLFLFFLLKDGKRMKNSFLKFVPNVIFERAYYLVFQFNRQIGDYIFAKFIEATIVGVIITSGLLIMDIRFAFLLGVIAGVTNIIPYLGPVLGIIPGVLVCFVDYGMTPTTGAVLILYGVANVIDLAFVFPILVSKIVDLHPVVVVVSVIVGSQYMGIAGMVVSIPLAASLKLLFQEVYKDIFPNTSRGL